MTFCPFYTTCADGSTCHRALTDEVINDAMRANLPTSNFIAPPVDCYKEIAIDD